MFSINTAIHKSSTNFAWVKNSNRKAFMSDEGSSPNVKFTHSAHFEKTQKQVKNHLFVKSNHVRRVGSDSQLQVPLNKGLENDFENSLESQEQFPVSPFSFSSDDTNIQKWGDSFDLPSADSHRTGLGSFFPEGQSYLSKAAQRVSMPGTSNTEEKRHTTRKIKPPRISFQQSQEPGPSLKSRASMAKKMGRRQSFTQGNWPPISSAGTGSGNSTLDQASTRRSSASEFVTELPDGSFQQLRWKNKSSSQSHAINSRYKD